ncbi:hypothetical protein [Anaeromyxobacter oryzae]|uniref:STAS domain-containing protein n=1 Tax=Anaeromyxobacter oryzae TaxID=2918170 RepID=A0ABN6N0N1_9BACT|nr:hypothetical protein [Anaeromyxobacter oryzae]BDG06636.1 hypothetical protein AMOR_56320 [Anaeromyxobacter oryzae]
MTGAAIVRREADDAIVLAVYGAFDGSSAWALRLEMDESRAHDFIVDLTHAEEACDFAACLLAAWAREHRREKRVRFRPGEPDHVRLLVGFGLEVLEDEDRTWATVEVPATGPALRLEPLDADTSAVA